MSDPAVPLHPNDYDRLVEDGIVEPAAAPQPTEADEVMLAQFLNASLRTDLDALAPNRAAGRRRNRDQRAAVRSAAGWKILVHPVFKRLTPFGVKTLARRRRANAAARVARRQNRS